jgi:hypothetical protein
MDASPPAFAPCRSKGEFMHTVLSAFDDSPAARRAVERLLQEGLAREDVHVEGGEGPDQDGDSVSRRTIASPEREIAIGPRAMSTMSHFFDHLLGRAGHDAHASVYTEAVRRGSPVVVVDAASEQEAEMAARIMDECGAYDIVERVEQWRQDGWSAVAAGQEQLEGGAIVRWRTAHVVHRPAGTPLREVVRSRRDPPPDA